MKKKELQSLQIISAKVRKDIILMSLRSQSAHLGGSLSCVEILVSLYFKIMKTDPKNPLMSRRDRLVFSKAHDAKALYAILSNRGFIKQETLLGYEKTGGKLPGHTTRTLRYGIETSCGSLGHGLSMASGIALAGKLKKSKYRVFAVLSDGECDEGSTWEAILFAAHHELDNLIAIVDYNKLQGYGFTKDILNLEPFGQKWLSFGWETREVNGHNLEELIEVLVKVPLRKNKPTAIIAHTIKGFGGPAKYVNQISSQYIPPSVKEAEEAISKLKII